MLRFFYIGKCTDNGVCRGGRGYFLSVAEHLTLVAKIFDRSFIPPLVHKRTNHRQDSRTKV